MKTRKQLRNGKKIRKTRKGGKTEKENYENYESVWKKDGYYDPKMNYPNRLESWVGYTPQPRKELHEGLTQNTYIIKRHGFSCANMLKEQKTVKQYTIADPSLCSYGIFSLLRDKTKPEKFDGIVFVSSLVRTWQTAILEYGSYGPLTLIVSPYIKEKDSHPLDKPNFPLPFPRQLAKMEQFMKWLSTIDSAIAKKILSEPHTIVKERETKTFGPYPVYPPIAENMYLETIKNDVLHKEIVPKKEVEAYVFIPSAKKIPHPDYSKYYKAEGFLYFDSWVGEHFPSIKTVFVVSHSGFMQKIIKQFSARTIETDIFKQNVWTLRISPKEPTDPTHLKMNYKLQISPGISKPTPEELEHMNRQSESLCNAVSEHDIDPRDQSPRQESSHSVLSSSSHSRRLSENDQIDLPRSRFESDASDVNLLSFLTEEIPYDNIKSTPVTTEKKDAILTRSFTELVHMLRDARLAQNISELIRSSEDFKTKAMNFVVSDPTVQIADPTKPKSYFKKSTKVPIKLFENHYLAFILMDTSYFDSIVQKLEASTSVIIDTALAYFNIRSSSTSIIDFLKSLRNLIDQDTEFYQLLVKKFSTGANKHYYLKAVPYYFAFTLLDLLLYEFNPTTENMDSMYRFIIDLVKSGARFSTTIYSRDDAVADWINFPSGDIIPLSMPSVELEPIGTEQKEYEITVLWEDAKRRLDPENELSQLNKEYLLLKRSLNDEQDKLQPLYDKARYQEDELTRIYDQFLEKNRSLIDKLEEIKRKYSEAKARLDPNNEFMELRLAMRKAVNTGIYNYLNMHLADLIDSEELKRAHNAMLKPLLEPLKRSEPVVSIGGSRGTSWKRSLLRQSSVKAGRYRALQYKGKRRTKVNRS